MSFAVTYYYSRKYETAYFERGKIAKIMLSGGIMFSVVFALQMYYWYSPLKMIAYILLGFAGYVDRTTASYMRRLQLEHYDKI